MSRISQVFGVGVYKHRLNNARISHVLIVSQSHVAVFTWHVEASCVMNAIKCSAKFEFRTDAVYVYLRSASLFLHAFGAIVGIFISKMSKRNKYVVVDWGSSGINFHSASKIVVDDPFNVREGEKCSIQEKDPVTKMQTMYHGQVLAVFGEFVYAHMQCLLSY